MSGYESGASLPSRSMDNGSYTRLETPRASSRSFELPVNHVMDISSGARSFSAADLYHVDAKMATNTNSSMVGPSTPRPDHRSRFLSDNELLLAANPVPTRESFATLNETDEKTWHQRSTELISKMLNTNLERGLNGMDVERRVLRYGYNALEEEAQTPVVVIFLLQFYNLIIAMLLIAALASLALQEWVEGIAILIIVTLNAGVATYQEHSASNALAALASLSSPQSLVIRDGMQQVIDSKQLVPGDIVILVTGDVVPADIRLFTSVDLKCNEMLLTGESEDVAKKYNAPTHVAPGKTAKLTASNMVFSSTTITAGNARGIVVETGMNTRVGSIAALLQEQSGSPDAEESKKWIRNPISDCVAKHRPKLTPLQRVLHGLGFLMGLIAISVAVLVFIVGMVRNTGDPRHPTRPVWLNVLMAAVSIVVSAVPEGLPMVVTICLSSGTAEMIRKNVLVRKLAAVETLGAASVICTDKTGTLTEGKMTAVKLWGDFQEYTITGKGFTPEGSIVSADGTSQAEPEAGNIQLRATLMASVLCSNTQLKQVEGEDGESSRWMPFGNSSEAPLVVAAAKAGIWEDNLLDDYPRLVEVPFSSSRKMMITVNAVPALNGTAMFDTLTLPGDKPPKLVANVKGAPNYILRNCTQYCRKDGKFETLTTVQRNEISEAVDALSSQALRVLAVAIQPMHELPYPKDCDDVDEKFAALSKSLVFLGLVASIDPERDGVRDAIATARGASIRTVMITGDYLATAVAIARNIDLLQVGADPEAQATDCTQLRPNDVYLPPADIDEITSRTLVFARAKPEDKIEIVKSLQRQGLIAAMTGDGVNDAPALKESDIGVAMGISGTEVAKGASDMILTDDNFCSIVSAVEKGRVIYANIQKFVMFLLSTNIGEILLIFLSVAGGFPLPLEALHILLLNLFTDGMPAVALSLEKGDPHIMNDKPRHKHSPLILGRLWLLVLFNAFLLLAGATTTFLLGLYWNFGELLSDDIYNAGGGSDGTDYSSVTCKRWEGMNDGWRTYGNCAAQYTDGSYIFGDEVAGMNAFSNSTVYCEGGEYECISAGLGRTQTMVFLGLAFTEVLRAYTVRHFTEPVFTRMLSNGYMQLAACMSLILTVLVTNVPVIMDDIFGFEYISWYQWLVVGAVAFNSAFWGEVLKAILRRHDRAQARWDHMKAGFEEILLEIRHVRHHVERLEAGGLKRE
ncbi:Calcium-transporting ATPase 1 [Phytophthora citrophthora]|uniref:Calcium-transporting ATPase 1 n=1 Tax=Phytophthora citrophthora TaxID=4793 RepID=A0AAD9GZG4_9STRA|nr:Calcium-transporting ATPase 1 [Phytophthora citrophthora]